MVREGGMVRVADRIGFVRTESLGKLGLRRSADFVSSRRRFGTLVRRGVMECRKLTEEGGGEGEASITFTKDDVSGIEGRGGCGSERVDELGSISGSGFEEPLI